MAKDFIRLIPAKSINSASLSGTFAAVDAAGLPYACFELRITNGGSTLVEISIDGSNTQEVVLPNQSIVLSGEKNRQPNNEKCYYARGTVIYARGTAGTGFIWVSGYYQI